MNSAHKSQLHRKSGRSIFHTLFIPLIIIMICQATIFYFIALYGGIERSLSQNAADILNERLQNRTNELTNMFTNTWTNFDASSKSLNESYAKYQNSYGTMPFVSNPQVQIQFLDDVHNILIDTLRQDEVNGVFLILNDQVKETDAIYANSVNKYGLCIRDMDSKSTYTTTEDLLLERAPSALISSIDCSLDSWWEAQYYFTSKTMGDYYFNPLTAAYQNPDTSGEDLAYFSPPHRLSLKDPSVISYSIPLLDSSGFPYAVLGIELTTKYLSSLLPESELDNTESGCYIIAIQDKNSEDYLPLVFNGTLFNRCFDSSSVISTSKTNAYNGFDITGRNGVELYGSARILDIYNNNNPFDSRSIALIALEDKEIMFAYIDHIKYVLRLVALLTLLLGSICIIIVSRNFARPITALSTRVRNMTPEEGFNLGRLGILEIDQLVASIETLNRNVSKNTARTEFFSRMSHDMRTPMNAIISFSSPELLEDADEATKDSYLEKIHSSGDYLLGLINEVLDLTKIESKRTDLVYEPVLLSHAWTTVIPIIDKLAQKKQIKFVKNIIDIPNLYVLADEQHLNQITLNLLSNAVKFTPEHGQVTFSVIVERPDDNPKQLRCQIIVKDTGIGISEEFMKNLYTPFEQENDGKEGTGLGLSIAKKLVELMHGSIDCYSEQGSGTTFHIDIPFDICDIPVASSISNVDLVNHQKEYQKDCLKGKRILVCEDHPLNTQIICKLLEKEGMIVTTAADGQIGLSIFAESALNSFDAILMDIRMPNLNGLETTTSIRALDRPDAMDIPIIAMTANAFAEDVNASRKAGMNSHLSKPIEPQKLYQTLIHYLGDA